MSQLFSISRFGRLFGKHTAEHFKAYLMATGVLLGGLGLVLGFAAYASSSPFEEAEQTAFFTLGVFGAGSFFTSTVFAPFGDRKQATAALLLPASHWEKFLVGWVYSLLVFLAVYIGCFYLVDSLVLQLDSHTFGPEPGLVPLVSKTSNVWVALVGYAVVNSVFLWGSIFFPKQHFIRTAFGVLLVAGLLLVLNFKAMQALLGHELSTVIPFASLTLHEGKQWYSVRLPEEQNSWFGLVPLGLMLLAWAAAYARVTEKQI